MQYISVPLDKIKIITTFLNVPGENVESDLTAKEKKILNAVREGNYDSITIDFQNRQPMRLRKLDRPDKRQLLSNLLKSTGHFDMRLIGKNGKVHFIHREIEETL